MKQEPIQILNMRDLREAKAAVRLFAAAGIRASTNSEELRMDGGVFSVRGGAAVFIFSKDAARAEAVLEAAHEFLAAGKASKKLELPPREGTLEFLDMLVHDCRQYLMIAAGEIGSIEEEGDLRLDAPTNDPKKIAIRLKRLKSQCMSAAGKQPLDWQHGGGLASED